MVSTSWKLRRRVRRTAKSAFGIAAPSLLLLLAPSAPVALKAAPRGAALEAAVRSNDPVSVDWRTLAGLDVQTGKMSEALERLNGKLVRIPGFMVPLDDDAKGVTEFLLVPFFGACIHVPPPPPNQIVYVRLSKKVPVDWWNPIWAVGRLQVTATESEYGPVSFQLAGLKIEPYKG